MNRHCETTSPRKSTKSALVWRAAVFPCTRRLFVTSAAYSDNVPWRAYSNPCRSARPGHSGNTDLNGRPLESPFLIHNADTFVHIGGFGFELGLVASHGAPAGEVSVRPPATRGHLVFPY